jgi:hypothetical protein
MAPFRTRRAACQDTRFVSEPPPSRSLAVVAAAILIAMAVIQARVALGGQTWADVRYHTEIAPPRLAAAVAIRGGELPLWWEGSGLGVPLAAEPSHGSLYPLGWLAASARGLDLLALLHLAWGAIGIAVWARRRASTGASGASDPAAATAALLAVTSGAALSAAVRGALPALAQLPWIAAAALALAGATDRRARGWAAGALALLLGLVGLTGSLALLVHGSVLAVLLGARRRTAGWLAGALAAGVALGAAQLLPAIAHLASGTAAGAAVHPLPLARLLELVVPSASGAGDPSRAIRALAGDAAWAPSIFVGAPLIALAAVRAPTHRLRVALAAGAVAALAAGRGPWPAWLGAPELHLAALTFLLAPAAAAGIDALVAGDRRARRALTAATACAAVALIALGVLRGRAPDAAAPIARALVEGALGLAAIGAAIALAWRGRQRAAPAVLALLVIPSAGAGGSTAPFAARAAVSEPPLWAEAARGAPLAPPQRAEAASQPGDASAPRRVFRPAIMHDLDRPHGAPATGSSRAGAALPLDEAVATLAGAVAARWGVGAARSEDPARAVAHDEVWLAAARDGGALLDRFGIDLAILPETLVVPRGLRALAIRNGWALVAFPAAPPAAVAVAAASARTNVEALALLFPADGKLPRDAIVLAGATTRPAPRPPSAPSRAAPAPIACRIARWRPGDIELACRAPSPGWAVISSASAPGWRVEVDGRPAAWVTADVLRRAVEIAAGDRAVRWTYAPPLGSAGLTVSGAAWALLALLAPLAGATRRPRARPP